MRTSKWRTLRVVVEYRTQRDTSEKDLRSAVQYLLDNSHGLTMEQFGESRLWVKGFNAFRSRSEAARPTRLRAAIRRLESAVKKLKEI